ncbi:unnamed protein product [Prunus brigantina]
MAGWIHVSAIHLECFDINQEWYNIEYEGLLDICYLCGQYGHKREHCEKRNSIPAPVPGEGQSSVAEDVLGARRRSKQCIRIREVEVMGLELRAQDLMLCMVEPSIGDEDLGKKVWTKSKVVKTDVRATLNDISNKPQQDKKHLTATAQKEGGSKSTSFGALIARGKMVIGGKRVESSQFLPDKVPNWEDEGGLIVMQILLVLLIMRVCQRRRVFFCL